MRNPDCAIYTSTLKRRGASSSKTLAISQFTCYHISGNPIFTSPAVRNSCLIKWTSISMPAFLSSLAKTFGSIWHYSVCLICLNSYCFHLEELPLSFEMERNQLLQNIEIVWIFIHSWMWSKRTYNDDMGWILCLVNHHMIYIKEIIF